MAAQYAYVGDVTLKEFAEIKKAFPDLMGIGVMENEKGEQYIALGVPSDIGDKACGMYQSIVDLFFDDELRRKVADVIWNEGENEISSLKLQINILKHQLRLADAKADSYKADAIKWAKKYDDLGYEYNKLYAAYFDGKLIFKEKE